MAPKKETILDEFWRKEGGTIKQNYRYGENINKRVEYIPLVLTQQYC